MNSYYMTREEIREMLQTQADCTVECFPVDDPPEGFRWKVITEVTFKDNQISWDNKWVAEPK